MTSLAEIIAVNGGEQDATITRFDRSRPWHPESLSEFSRAYHYLPSIHSRPYDPYQGHIITGKIETCARTLGADLMKHFLRNPSASYALADTSEWPLDGMLVYTFAPISAIPCNRRVIVGEAA